VISPLSAQPAQRAAATITESDFRRRINIIADDSMGGRDTPSPGLESTAQYLAREFARMGLKPAGDSGYFQRYGVWLRDLDTTGSTISFSDQAVTRVTLELGRDAKLMNGAPAPDLAGELVLAGGPITATTSFDPAVIRGRILVWAADYAKTMPSLGQILIAAANAGASLLVVSVNSDSAFAALRQGGKGIVVAESVGWPAVLAVRESAILAAVPEAADGLTAARTAAAPMPTAVPWVGRLNLRYSRNDRTAVPNVVAMVPGTDPVLRDEYLVYSAHFDHVGSRCRGSTEADRICNGADDNGSGTTGLLELAEAFAHRDAKPRRSVLFVGVSGEERGLWGSEYFARNPTVPIDRIVANINMDHLGRNWRDSIVVIGREHSDLGQTVDQVAAANPGLGVGVLPDQWPNERIYFRSDHYNFAREGVPILFFTNGFHPDYHAVTDSPDKIDAEKGARVVRLIFHTGLAIANRTERPKWNPESERQIVRRRSAPVP
jgi:hypothetical protein